MHLHSQALDGQAVAFERGAQRTHILFKQRACLRISGLELRRHRAARNSHLNAQLAEVGRIETHMHNATALIDERAQSAHNTAGESRFIDRLIEWRLRRQIAKPRRIERFDLDRRLLPGAGEWCLRLRGQCISRGKTARAGIFLRESTVDVACASFRRSVCVRFMDVSCFNMTQNLLAQLIARAAHLLLIRFRNGFSSRRLRRNNVGLPVVSRRRAHRGRVRVHRLLRC